MYFPPIYIYNDCPILKHTHTMDFSELRKAIEEVELVDGHAHNLVALDSIFAFIHAFSLAHGDTVSFSPHSLSFKVTPSFLTFL